MPGIVEEGCLEVCRTFLRAGVDTCVAGLIVSQADACCMWGRSGRFDQLGVSDIVGYDALVVDICVMTAFVYSQMDLIGSVDLKIGDESMGCVYGEFMPNESYYSKIQSLVREFNTVHDLHLLHSLRLNVQLENGFFLFPQGGVTIDDFPDEPMRIDVMGLHWHVIKEYFQSNTQASFVEEPWVALNIERKIELENELKREIEHRRKSIFSGFTDNTHVLTDYSYSALCASLQFDDVLFAVWTKGTSAGDYAVVHLTWADHKERNPLYPWTTFFESFDAFKECRMYRDKAEWEH